MIYGFDISHHNGKEAVSRCFDTMLGYEHEPKFCFIKITEGKTYVDSRWEENVEAAIAYDLVVGLYHYARPENNSAMEEAKFFCENYRKIHTVLASDINAIPILDWEGEALKRNRKWVREWCDYVYTELRIRPMVYLSRSECHMHLATVAGNYGLWVAAWRDIEKGVGNVAPWPTWAVWQFTSDPFDMDVFNGTVEQLKKYAIPENHAPNVECLCDCHYCGCCHREGVD